jgi:hypothetical protein
MDYLLDDLSEESSLPDPFRKSPMRAEPLPVDAARRYMKDSFQQCMMEAEEEAREEAMEEERHDPPEDKSGQGGVHFAVSTKAPAEDKVEEQYSPQITGGAFFRPQTPLFDSPNPANAAAGQQQGGSHQGYTLVADLDTVAYFSGRDIISKIAHIHRTADVAAGMGGAMDVDSQVEKRPRSDPRADSSKARATDSTRTSQPPPRP